MLATLQLLLVPGLGRLAAVVIADIVLTTAGLAVVVLLASRAGRSSSAPAPDHSDVVAEAEAVVSSAAGRQPA